MSKKVLIKILILSLSLPTISGCVSKKSIMEDIQASENRQDIKITALRQEMNAEIDKLGNTKEAVAKVEKNSLEALKKAQEANQAVNRLRADFASRNKMAKKMEEVVLFGFDQYSLDDIARSTLNQIAALLNRDAGYVAVIEGHTDSKGSESYNYALSYRRVSSVIGYLVAEKSIDLNRIHLAGLGENYPVANNSSENGRKQNRRVVIKIMAPL